MKWNKNKNTKIPSSFAWEDVYDKKGNILQALYRKILLMLLVKNKNGNKLDGNYYQLNQDEDKGKKPIEIFWIIHLKLFLKEFINIILV